MEMVEGPWLSKLTTLGLGGQALALLKPSTLEDLAAVPGLLARLGGDPLVLGRGSNLLCDEGELPLVLISPKFLAEPEILEEDEHRVKISVGAGVGLPKLLQFCAKNGFSGLEGLAGIPGTVGGAIAMNAGSFGTETCARLCQVEIWQPAGLLTLGPESFSYAYRTFKFLGSDAFYVIYKAYFSLTKACSRGIFSLMNLKFLEKKSKQPIQARSAGCVFKNPSKDKSAGYLLEAAGFKGKKLGGMAFSSLHANFLLNLD
ncbi:MAG: FAD-binding protein, partial [Desulfovibrionaceae bacterium]|nr:FAD-binding protein [Desulfovibrionaceae bacterium]